MYLLFGDPSNSVDAKLCRVLKSMYYFPKLKGAIMKKKIIVISVMFFILLMSCSLSNDNYIPPSNDGNPGTTQFDPAGSNPNSRFIGGITIASIGKAILDAAKDAIGGSFTCRSLCKCPCGNT
jgi:hypothetical protein